ncbi:hypothetical protein M0R72_11230 [Candidatus Pacearchaeota archaeon]|jgi:hypothetical protein|nr:hypothetical protein [Candidatus Pacearchaeota archaeon]
MKPSKIFVTLDHNEASRPRAAKVEKAVLEDEHYEMNRCGNVNLPFDLHFRHMHLGKEMHVELKDFSEDGNSDYLDSILNGHLWAQVTAGRELGEPAVVVVFGDDNDVGAAIRKASGHGRQGHRVDPEKLMEYHRMVEGFEANCIALGVQIWRLKTDPYKRMLLRVRKILEGGDLSGFAPHPAAGERQVVGLSILAGRGVGPKKARELLERFDVCLRPKDGCSAPLEDCGGIGPKLADRIRKNIMVIE